MSLKKIFATNLKKYRKLRGLTQENLAELVNVAPRHISFIETERSFPSCELLERICSVLNIEYSSIFEIEEDLPREEIIKRIIQIADKLDCEKLKYIYKMINKI